LGETRLNAENRLKIKLLYVQDQALKDSVRIVYLSLINDLEYLHRLKAFDVDIGAYSYLRDKLKLEIDGP
jgi:hypothetical protein